LQPPAVTAQPPLVANSCHRPTTTCSQQWFIPPTIGIRAPFVRKQKSFGIYPNFQSCQKHFLIIPQCRFHPYELTGAKISFIGSRGSPRVPPEHSALSPRAPRKKTTGVHVRHIRAEPSRLSRLQSRSISRAEEYSPEYSRFNPSEPPDVKNRFPDRFSSFLTHFQQSQTSSLLF